MIIVNRAIDIYQRDAVLSASPGRLITMLYDRLLVELHRAAEAQQRADWVHAGGHLRLAQDIVTELAVSLDTTRWPEGRSLAAVYDYVGTRLVHANVHRDPAATAEAIALLDPLRLTWHEALEAVPVTRRASGVA